MDKPEIIRKFCMARVDFPYIFATSGADCKPEVRRERAAAKPDYAANIKKYCPVLSGKQTACVGCKYEGKQAYDCRGLTLKACDAAGIKISGIGASSQWNGDYWAEKGPISQMPKDKVCCVFRRTASANPMGHTGMYMGDGHAIEARGHEKGVIRGKLESYPWTDYAIPRGLYDTVSAPVQPSVEESLPMLRKGAKGEYVKALQNLLLSAGQQLPRWGVDGDFGAETEAAVKAFQQINGIKVDGVAGPATWAGLLDDGEIEDEPREDLYTVTIPGLSLGQADALLAAWAGATKAVG